MANAREILGRIHSIQDTRKITSAMYMISSTKLRKARRQLENTEPYFHTLQQMIGRILAHMPDIRHPYFEQHEDKSFSERRQGYVVITADKGMAGAYNHHVLKLACEQLEKNENRELYVVGEVGRQYFLHRNIEIDRSFLYTAQNPSLHRARDIAGELVDRYLAGELDEIWVIFTYMKNGLVAEPQMTRLLPLSKEHFEETAAPAQQEMLLLPTPQAALDNIVPDYVTGFLYGALVESFCSEQNERMMAMDAATKSADEMLKTLSVTYNRVRQGLITQQITEVIGGAKALQTKQEE